MTIVSFDNCIAVGNGRDGFNIELNIFDALNSKIAGSELDAVTKSDLHQAVHQLRNDLKTKSFVESYESFIASVGGHVTLFGPILTHLLNLYT